MERPVIFGKLFKKTTEKSNKESLVEAPYMPKISSITDAGIEFYWKKPEKANGYEVYRSYSEKGGYEKIAEINKRKIGTYTDNDFDHSKKEVFYQARSFVKVGEERIYSEFTESTKAEFRNELTITPSKIFMYDGASRKLEAYWGWGTADDATWSTDNAEVATVDEDGVITAVAKGVCNITCSSDTLNQSTSCRIEVNRESLPPLPHENKRFWPDESTGHWVNREAEDTGDAVIIMTGDLMCGSAQMRKQYTEEHGMSFNDTFEYVREVTQTSDFAIGNLETLMAPGWPYMLDESYINNMNNCNAPSRYLDAVLYGGFDAVTLANNHNCDGGTRALEETLAEIEKREIPYTGAYNSEQTDRYFIVNVNGIKVGVLAYMSRFIGFNGKDADWTEEEKSRMLNIFNPEKASREIAACRAAGAEYVIVYMHWGMKNFRDITKKQAIEAEEAANAGADYIVGANPHILQQYDELHTEDGRTVPCYYSLGNFQAYMNQIPGNRDSIYVRIRLRRTDSGEIVLAENNYIPTHVYKDQHGCHWAPVVLTQTFNSGADKPHAKAYVKRIAESVGDKISIYE